nr:hypothetical protein F6W77_19445 [Acinetobacter baumannii]
MKTSLCIVLFLIGVVFGRTPKQSNSFMDAVLQNVKTEGRNKNIDPAHLLNFTSQHKDKIAFVGVKVNVSYYNVVMTGLFKVDRERDCSGVRRDFGNVTLNCTLVFNDVKIKYDLNVKYGKLPKVSPKVKAELKGNTAFAAFTTSMNRNYPALKTFYFVRRGQPKISVSGLGPLNSTVKKFIETTVIAHAHNEFLNVVNYNWVPVVNYAASRIPMPSL